MLKKKFFYDYRRRRRHVEVLEYEKPTPKRVIRFVGAFGHSDSLRVSLLHELRTSAERCATTTLSFKLLRRCKVALEFEGVSVVKQFHGDCWSSRRKDGKLSAGRVNEYSDHDEVWVKGSPAAILISPEATGETKRTVAALAKMFKLPVRGLPAPEQAVDYDPERMLG